MVLISAIAGVLMLYLVVLKRLCDSEDCVKLVRL